MYAFLANETTGSWCNRQDFETCSITDSPICALLDALNEEASRRRTTVSQRALAPNHHGPEQSSQSFHQVLDVHLDWFTFPLQSVL